ncbi:MAG TPA: alpha/beta fold hydrolase, partial [Mesotoga infera]|nr:alpha/beta fold hydrolase [Mesotoga infera]
MKVTRRAPLAVILVLLLGTMLLAAETEYTVVKGDTLWEIAKAYDVDWKEIAELNGITDEYALQVGTVLKIPAAYTEISVMIPNIDHDIPAVICIPEGDGPFPIVVMLHGTGSDKSEAGGGYLLAAPALAEAGIASVRFDFIGNGESTADYIDYNFTSAVDDTNIAFAYAASLPRIDGHRAGIMGWSQGGTIALLAAGQNP